MSIYDKPSREMLLEAINRDNGLVGDKALTWDQIATGFPEVISGESIPFNTRVMLYGLNGQGYKGTVTIEYNRIDMPTLFQGLVPTVITDPQNSLVDLLPALNKAYGLSLIADDIIDQSVKDLGTDWQLDVTMRPGCLAWQGGFRMRFAKFIPNLRDVVKDVDLNVIIAPFTLGPKPRVEYVGYGYDWTEAYTVITDTVNKTQWLMNHAITAADVDMLNGVVPLNFAFVNGAAAKDGQIALVGAVFKGILAVTPNSDYSPAFSNVAIIALAADSNYVGNLILHMNPL